jgi:NAD(P)-dependent dehydrogenase (short-subunit alcohol dehydrogenase family)
MTCTLVVGGSGGLGRVIAQRFADRGDSVLITSRDKARAGDIAAQIGSGTQGIALDLANPNTTSTALSEVSKVDSRVITAVG